MLAEFFLDAVNEERNKSIIESHLKMLERTKSFGSEGYFAVVHLSLPNFMTPRPFVRRGDLAPIPVGIMTSQSFHHGCFLSGELVVEPLILSAIHTVLQDMRGELVRVSLHNVIPPDAPLERREELAKNFCSKGSFVAITDPYYKIAADWGMVVRVEDPAYFQVINGPLKFSSEDYFGFGQQLVVSSQNHEACYHFGRCIDVLDPNEKIAGILLSNAAACMLELASPLSMEAARRTALLAGAAIAVDPSSAKAFYRLGVALEVLGDSGTALWAVRNAMKVITLSPECAALESRVNAKCKGNIGSAEADLARRLVGLIAFDKDHVPDSTISFSEKFVASAVDAKRKGNEFFKQKNFRCALKEYCSGIRLLSFAGAYLSTLSATMASTGKKSESLIFAIAAIIFNPRNRSAIDQIARSGWSVENPSACKDVVAEVQRFANAISDPATQAPSESMAGQAPSKPIAAQVPSKSTAAQSPSKPAAAKAPTKSTAAQPSKPTVSQVPSKPAGAQTPIKPEPSMPAIVQTLTDSVSTITKAKEIACVSKVNVGAAGVIDIDQSFQVPLQGLDIDLQTFISLRHHQVDSTVQMELFPDVIGEFERLGVVPNGMRHRDAINIVVRSANSFLQGRCSLSCASKKDKSSMLSGKDSNYNMMRTGTRQPDGVHWFRKAKAGETRERLKPIESLPHHHSDGYAIGVVMDAGNHIGVGLLDILGLAMSSIPQGGVKYAAIFASQAAMARNIIMMEMVINGCDAETLVQFLYSTVWNEKTQIGFEDAVKSVLQIPSLQAETKRIVEGWAQFVPDIADLRMAWLSGRDSSPMSLFPAFAKVEDRVALMNYFLSGELGQGEFANVTMISRTQTSPEPSSPIPPVYAAVPLHVAMEVRLKGAPDIVEAYKIVLEEAMANLIEAIRSEKVAVESHFVAPFDLEKLAKRIRPMKPRSIYWEEMPERVSWERLHTAAKLCSTADTVHHMSSALWWTEIKGSTIEDWPAEKWAAMQKWGAGRVQEFVRAVGYKGLVDPMMGASSANLASLPAYRSFFSKWLVNFFSKSKVAFPSAGVSAKMLEFDPSQGLNCRQFFSFSYDSSVDISARSLRCSPLYFKTAEEAEAESVNLFL